MSEVDTHNVTNAARHTAPLARLWFVSTLALLMLAVGPASAQPDVSTVLWRHQYDLNYFWQLNVDKATPIGLPPVAGSNWVVRGFADLDGDGMRDIIWQETATGLMYAWFMNATDVKPNGVVGLGVGAGSEWTLAAVADFNGDGIADFLWWHKSGWVYLWCYHADRSFSVFPQVVLIDPAEWRMAGTGDLDGNGTADVVWTAESPVGNSIYVWLMDHAGGIQTQWGAGDGGVKRIERIGDFDGDGMADVLWTDPVTGETDVWYMNGVTFSSVTQPMPSVPVGFRAGATGDFNGDGKSDIVWFDASSGQAIEWLMNARGAAPTQNSLGMVGPTWFLPPQ